VTSGQAGAGRAADAGPDPKQPWRQQPPSIVCDRRPGKLVGGVLGGGVVTLPGHDDNPVRPADHQRLVTGGVAWRGHERDFWQHSGWAGQLLETAAVDEFGEGVVRCVPGGAEFCCLDEDRQPG